MARSSIDVGRSPYVVTRNAGPWRHRSATRKEPAAASSMDGVSLCVRELVNDNNQDFFLRDNKNKQLIMEIACLPAYLSSYRSKRSIDRGETQEGHASSAQLISLPARRHSIKTWPLGGLYCTLEGDRLGSSMRIAYPAPASRLIN